MPEIPLVTFKMASCSRLVSSVCVCDSVLSARLVSVVLTLVTVCCAKLLS